MPRGAQQQRNNVSTDVGRCPPSLVSAASVQFRLHARRGAVDVDPDVVTGGHAEMQRLSGIGRYLPKGATAPMQHAASWRVLAEAASGSQRLEETGAVVDDQGPGTAVAAVKEETVQMATEAERVQPLVDQRGAKDAFGIHRHRSSSGFLVHDLLLGRCRTLGCSLQGLHAIIARLAFFK